MRFTGKTKRQRVFAGWLVVIATVLVAWVQTTTAATIGYWRFEEASGLALDASGSGVDGTLLGGATRSALIFGSPVPQTGATNTRSMSFDGVTGTAVNMGNGINVDAGNFTLETYVRIKPNGATNYPLLAGKLVSGNFLDRGFELQARPDAVNGGGEAGLGKWKALFRASDDFGGSDDVFSPDLEFDTWYHLAGVRSGNTLRLYVDGVQVGGDVTPSGSFTSGQEFSVGGANTTGGPPGSFGRALNGFVDEVRLSDAALAPSQFLNATAVQSPTTPGFILGWYHNHSGGNETFDEIAAHGFNTIMDYELSLLAENGNGQIVHDQLTGAADRGIGVQFHLSGDLIRSTDGGNWGRLDAVVNRYKNYPGLASWQMSDEPESSDFIPVAVFQAAADHIRQIDTNHPVSTVFTKEDMRYQPYVPHVDIASIDNYPIRSDIPNPDLRAYTKSAKRLVELASASSKRTLFVVQAFVADPEFSEPFVQPTTAQQRFLTYAPLTLGVAGLMYWTYYRNSPETRATNVYPVTDFLAGLIPVLESTNPTPPVSSSDDSSSFGDGLADVTYLVRQYQGSIYIIAANNLATSNSVQFTVQGQWPATTVVRALTENRTVSSPNLPGVLTFSDTFGPYQIHLYEVISAPIRPVVSISQSGNQVTWAWSVPGFVLQENDNVANPKGWTDMSNGGISPVTVQALAGGKFYRLIGR